MANCNCCKETVTPCTGVQESKIGELSLVFGKRDTSCDAWQTIPDFVCESLNKTYAQKIADGEVPTAGVSTDVVLTADCRLVNLNGAAAPETPLTVVDTPSVNLTSSGTAGHTLQADVNLSATAGNILIQNADGLFATATVVFDDQVLVASDTASVNLTLTPSAPSGTDNQVDYTIQADVKLSAVADNDISTNADGLYLDVTDAETPLTVADSTSINLTAGGTGNGHTGVTAALIVDPDATNLINVGAAGVSVLCEDVQDCVAPMFTPWAVYNDAANTVDLDPSTDANNVFTLGTDGKPFVPSSAAETALTVVDSTSINLTAGGSGNGHTGLTAALIIDPVANNLINVGADGVSVICEDIQDCVYSLFTGWAVYNDAANTITPDPSGDADNNLIIGTDGKLYSHYNFRVTTGATAVVPAGGVVVEDGDALHFWSATGIAFNITAGSAVVKADITVSADANNALSFGTDGKLYAPTASAGFITSLTDTDSINLTNTAGALSADVNISALPNNGLSIQADGLYMTQTGLSLSSPNGSMTTSVSGIWNHTAEVDVKVSTTAGNILTVDAGGVYVGACALGAQIALAGVEAFPVSVITIDSSNCPVRASAANYQVVFGNDDGKIQQDARFYFNNDTGAIAATAGGSTTAGSQSAAIGGVNQSAAGGNSGVFAGNGNTAAGVNAVVIGGNTNTATGDDTFVAGTSNIAAAGSNQSAVFGFGNVSNGQRNLVSGQGNTATQIWSIVTGQNNQLTNINNWGSAMFGQNNTASGPGVVVGGFSHNLAGTGQRVAVFGLNNDITNTNDASDSIIAGNNNVISGTADASLNAIFGNSNTVSNRRNIVAGASHTVSSQQNAVFGAINVVSSDSGIVAGSDLIGNAYACAVFGLMNENLPAANASSYAGTDHGFVLGNGQQSINYRSNAYAIRKDGVHQWYIARDNNNPGNKLPQYANNAAAIAGLAGSTLPATNLTFGALVMVDVAGVPTWFKFDGTTWLYAF